MFNFNKIASELDINKPFDLNTSTNNFLGDKISKIDISSLLNYIANKNNLNKEDSDKLLGEFWFEPETLIIIEVLLKLYCKHIFSFRVGGDRCAAHIIGFLLKDQINGFNGAQWIKNKLDKYNLKITWRHFARDIVNYFDELKFDKEFLEYI